MFPTGNNDYGFWNANNTLLGAGFFDWHKDFSDLPEEVKSYLSEHEGEIRSGQDVDRLIRTYNLKK